MATAALVPVAEYLATSYSPDCDYIDGAVGERNLGQREHALLQSRIPIWFWEHRAKFRMRAVTDWRIRVAADRYRVPDLNVLNLPTPVESTLTSAPQIIIEILSPEDTLPKLQQRIDDYLSMNAPNVWVIYPETRRAWTATRDGLLAASDDILRTTDSFVNMPLVDLFDEE